MAVKTFGVIGAGQMGNGIAQVAASPGGLNVIMNDIADQFVDRGYRYDFKEPGPAGGQGQAHRRSEKGNPGSH